MHKGRALPSGLLAGFASVALAVACVAGGVSAVEVWTPETGEVELEKAPRDTADARREHALALIGAGQWGSGIAELRALIEADPEGEWVPEARLAIAQGLLAQGDAVDAFEELEKLRTGREETPLGKRARELQFRAARVQSERGLGPARKLYDRIMETPADAEEAALAQKEKADAVFAAGRYVEAQDEYMALVDLYPYSEWVPYCTFKIAQCEWELARWLQLGMEGVRKAERSLRDFVETFPTHSYAPQAKEMLADARRTMAELCQDIAAFYIKTKNRPWAAVSYLDWIVQELAETPQAEWAAEELKAVKAQKETPLHGSLRPLKLDGVSRQEAGG